MPGNRKYWGWLWCECSQPLATFLVMVSSHSSLGALFWLLLNESHHVSSLCFRNCTSSTDLQWKLSVAGHKQWWIYWFQLACQWGKGKEPILTQKCTVLCQNQVKKHNSIEASGLFWILLKASFTVLSCLWTSLLHVVTALYHFPSLFSLSMVDATSFLCSRYVYFSSSVQPVRHWGFSLRWL